ncbi:hypothetical protein ACFP7A_00715 [Sporolactobacillus kofuensis]|uniref:DUF4190 domain-containing protein n=1 Tax=Sporolactobacillus kofuensis TaxID=269672 RepID=A0ABW1WA38_9BACL|nr:hypothetical protein [Sporolactobacillus kofuensis]MCO7175576.1 hypothetical protein [Sporolactobacillus kofuensis]
MYLQVVDWREIFDEQKKCRIAPVTAGSLLTLSPQMALGLGVIVIVGGSAILAAHLERKLAERGSYRAHEVAVFVIGTLMVLGFVGFAWLVIKNPLWGLFR